MSLEECEESVEVKVRGPTFASYATFFFMEDLLAMIDQVLYYYLILIQYRIKPIYNQMNASRSKLASPNVETLHPTLSVSQMF